MKEKDFVAEQLAKYKEYKQRLKIILNEYDINDIIEGNFGMSYDGVKISPTNAFSSDVENKVVALLDENMSGEYKDKLRFVRKVELALDGLGPAEKFIIERKFCLVDLQGEEVYRLGTVRDIDIYTLPEFTHKSNEYFKIKQTGIKRLSRMLQGI